MSRAFSQTNSCRLLLLESRAAGFSLVELLAVLAIVGLLAAILIPTVGSARSAAAKARTRAQFSQWTVAIESFRSEYGYYPIFDSSNLVNPVGQSTVASEPHCFHDLLAGRRRDGSALPVVTSDTAPTAPELQNRKLIAFHSFAEHEISASGAGANLLRDGAENTAIVVLVDRNLDGVVNSADFGADLPLVSGIRPTSGDFPAAGIRGGAIFYSPAPRATVDAPAFVFSWK